MDSTRTSSELPPWLAIDQIVHACRTDVGMRRSHNQDAYAAAPSRERAREVGHLFLVADGMGGHAVGEKASAKAASDIPHTYIKHAHEGASAALRKAFAEANAGIHAIGQENPEFRGMGTTGTALLLRAEGAWAAHVGDSRLYRIRDGMIEQLTFDHSALWEIAKRQRVRPEELHGIRSNVILRSLGPEGFVEVDIEGPHPIRAGDVYLLCSDGLSGSLTDSEIGAIASALPPAEACDFLVELTNLRGGPDNITVMIVRTGEADGHPAPAPKPAKWLPSMPRWRFPWPVSVLLGGMALAVLSIQLVVFEWPGGRLAFLLAAFSIVSGIVGLVFQSVNDPESAADETAPPKLRVYRHEPCRIEATLVDKLARAEGDLKAKLDAAGVGYDVAAFAESRRKADLAHSIDRLDNAFREHCRAMHLLLKSYNGQRQRVESFVPVWDKHRG